MAIKDLQPKQTNVEVIAEVIEVGEAREFQKFGKAGRVATARIKDDTGEVKLSLWNEQVDQVKEGDKVHIKNGYVGEWQGELQLTTGKFGSLEVLGGASDEKIAAVTEDEMTEKDAMKGEKEEAEHALTEDESTEEEIFEEGKKPVEEEDLAVEEESIDEEKAD